MNIINGDFMSKYMVSSELLMNDKSFYTLIRRFRYQYKKFKAIKDVCMEYSDKNLREAYNQAHDDLLDTTNRITLMVLGGFINPNNTEVELSQDVIEPSFGFGSRFGKCVCSERHHNVTVDDKEFWEFVIELFGHYWDD